MTTTSQINSTAAALTTYFLMPSSLSAPVRATLAASAAASVLALPEAHQTIARATISLFGGMVASDSVLPDNTPLKARGITALFGGATSFLLLELVDGKISTNPQTPATNVAVSLLNMNPNTAAAGINPVGNLSCKKILKRD